MFQRKRPTQKVWSWHRHVTFLLRGHHGRVWRIISWYQLISDSWAKASHDHVIQHHHCHRRFLCGGKIIQVDQFFGSVWCVNYHQVKSVLIWLGSICCMATADAARSNAIESWRQRTRTSTRCRASAQIVKKKTDEFMLSMLALLSTQIGKREKTPCKPHL